MSIMVGSICSNLETYIHLKMLKCMLTLGFEDCSVKVAQSEACNLLNEMINVLTNIQAIRGLLMDPLNYLNEEHPFLEKH
jgi:hypothetical protein